ncbi:MAG: four helix bundle protein [Terriglobia bacterium]|jgi:four helix bundle protein
MRNFRDLKVWRKAHEVTLDVYKSTLKFPKEEMYGLTSQIRRASTSTAANIAEGCGRTGIPEFSHFLQIASGSASELEYHLLLAHDLHFLDGSDYDRLNGEVTEIKRMLSSFQQKLRPSRVSLKADS